MWELKKVLPNEKSLKFEERMLKYKTKKLNVLIKNVKITLQIFSIFSYEI